MDKVLTVGNLTAKPGEVVRGILPYAYRVDGSPLGIPVVLVRGIEAGPLVAVDASCHGDEHEGTLAVLRLLETIDATQFRGSLVAVPLLNIPAVEAMQRGNPFDHWNSDLNRLYPGTAYGNLTQRIAYAHLEEIAAKADYSISIHSGASYIYWSPQGVCTRQKSSIELVKMLGPDWDIVWQQGEEKAPLRGNATEALGDRGVAAITIEVGGAAERMPEAFSRNTNMIKDALVNVLRHLGMIEGTARQAVSWQVVRQLAVRSNRAGILVSEAYPLLRKRVSAGTPLARLLNAVGEEVECVTAPVEAFVMGFRTYQYAPPGWPLVWLGEPVENWLAAGGLES